MLKNLESSRITSFEKYCLFSSSMSRGCCDDIGGFGSHHLLIWLGLLESLIFFDLFRGLKDTKLVVVREGDRTPNTHYSR